MGAQFIQQSPGDLFDLWPFRCRTEDQELAIWFDAADPVAGETYDQPAAADQAKIGFGSPTDIQPLGRLSANMTAMSVTVSEVDIDTGRFVGSFSASWSNQGGNYGELDDRRDRRLALNRPSSHTRESPR